MIQDLTQVNNLFLDFKCHRLDWINLEDYVLLCYLYCISINKMYMWLLFIYCLPKTCISTPAQLLLLTNKALRRSVDVLQLFVLPTWYYFSNKTFNSDCLVSSHAAAQKSLLTFDAPSQTSVMRRLQHLKVIFRLKQMKLKVGNVDK